MTTHSALSSLCLSALLTASFAHAQAPLTPGATAADMAVRMQAAVIDARNLVTEARVHEARQETLAASQKYNKALERLRGIGATADPLRVEVVDGLVRTTLQLADQAMTRGDYADATVQLDRVLKVDPGNKIALQLQAENERIKAELVDKMPTQQALDTIAHSETNRIRIAKMVQDGKLYYETGRYKLAEEVLREALVLNPGNPAASYYLDLVNAAIYNASARLREANSKQMLMEVEQSWIPAIGQSYGQKPLPVANPYARTNLVQTSDKRQKIYLKLRNMTLNEWGPIDNLPLSEVIRSLNDEILRRDTGGKGINLFISPNADSAGGGAGAGPALDPAGLPIPAAGGGASDLNGVSIRLGTKLKDLNLQEILDILMIIAETKIKYSVEDFGIMISPKANEPTPLHTRFFRLDPNTFQQGLQNVTSDNFGETQGGGSGGGGGGRNGGGGRGGGGGGGRGNRGGNNNQGGNQNGGGSGGGSSYATVSIAPGGANRQGGQVGGGAVQRPAGQAGGPGGGQQQQTAGGISFLTEVTQSASVIPIVTGFFTAAGVDLTTPGKAVFYNDRLGALMVRATLQDLDTIEKAIQMLNMSPPQLTIRAKFMEVTQDDSRALGFDWYLGNMLTGAGGGVGVQGGSAPSFYIPGQSESVANPSGVFPGPGTTPGVGGPGAIPASATDNLITSGLRNTAPSLATVTGILTDPQFRFVVRALEQRGGTDLLSAPEVTTESARQAQIKVVDIKYIVTDLDLDQTAAGGTGNGTVIGGTTGGGGVGSLTQPIAEPFELGPVLDVVPYVNADGFTIQLTLIPTLKEFLGYDDPGAFVAQIQSVGVGAAPPLITPTPLPKFRLRQVATSVTVWDGQTVVLGGLIAENVQKTKDKVPVLGDLPLLGRFFRSEANITGKKNLMIFVTPTIIDPAGNRMHSEEEMPFAQHPLPLAPRAAAQ